MNFTYPKGRISIYGYLFNSPQKNQTHSDEEIKNRIIHLWCEGAVLHQTDIGYLLLFQKPLTTLVDKASGTPILKQFGHYSNVIWPSAEGLPTDMHQQSLFFIQHDSCNTINLGVESKYDPSLWLDLSQYKEHPLTTLGAIHSPKITKSQSGKSIRTVLNDEALAESTELKATLKKLQSIEQGNELNKNESRGSALNALTSSIKGMFQSANKNGAQSPYPKYIPAGNEKQQSAIFKKIKALMSNYIRATALGKAIGNAQAKFVQNMVKQFEDGNLDEALRNAIPLSNLHDAMKSGGTSLSRKLVGNNLDSIQPYAQGGGGNVNLGDQVLAQLKAMYENAFKVMDSRGNYKKAAFILAELLRDIDRAVTYLEKHEQFQLAAELAEGQGLNPARIIRQWIIAGNTERAMHIAMISGAYEEAITALEHQHPKQADALRWQCALKHYQAGNLYSAVDIAWPMTEKRSTAITWMKARAQMGGELGARHLLRLALHDQDNYDRYLVQIDSLLKDNMPKEHLALYDEIISLAHLEGCKRIASLATRRYLISVAQARIAYDRTRWHKLCEAAGDLTLRADARNLQLSNIAKRQYLSDRSTVQSIQFEQTHGRRASDFTLFDGNILLIAFGDSGLEIRNNKGKIIGRLTTPCHNIIISEEKSTALLITERSGYQQVHKFDLQTRTSTHWLDVSLSCWASSYDGNTWLAAKDDKLFVLDVQAPQQVALWNITDLGGEFISIQRTKINFTCCIQKEDAFELWTYSLPNLFLKERSPYQQKNLQSIHPISFNANGLIVGANTKNGENNTNEFSLFRREESVRWHQFDISGEVINVLLHDRFVFFTSYTNDKTILNVFAVKNQKNNEKILTMEFSGVSNLSIKTDCDTLLIHHGDGRLLNIDFEYGNLLFDLVI